MSRLPPSPSSRRLRCAGKLDLPSGLPLRAPSPSAGPRSRLKLPRCRHHSRRHHSRQVPSALGRKCSRDIVAGRPGRAGLRTPGHSGILRGSREPRLRHVERGRAAVLPKFPNRREVPSAACRPGSPSRSPSGAHRRPVADVEGATGGRWAGLPPAAPLNRRRPPRRTAPSGAMFPASASCRPGGSAPVRARQNRQRRRRLPRRIPQGLPGSASRSGERHHEVARPEHRQMAHGRSSHEMPRHWRGRPGLRGLQPATRSRSPSSAAQPVAPRRGSAT